MPAGQYRFQLRFYARAVDKFGEPNGAWGPMFECAARVSFIRGGEAVLAGRLQGQRTASIRVDNFPETAAVTNAWACIDLDSGDRFDIKEATTTENRQYRDFLAESGAADGGELTEAAGGGL